MDKTETAMARNSGGSGRTATTMERIAKIRFLFLSVFFFVPGVGFFVWDRLRGRDDGVVSFDLALNLLVVILLWGGSGISTRMARRSARPPIIDDERDRAIAATARQWALAGLYVMLALSILAFAWPAVAARLPMAGIGLWIGHYLFVLLVASLWIESLVCVALYRRDGRGDA